MGPECPSAAQTGVSVPQNHTSDEVELALPTSAAMMERLKPIWGRVMHRASAEADDNFFALGGTPATARDLFQTVQHLDIASPGYGLQAKGSELKSEPRRNGPEMADVCASAIRKTRP